MSNVSKLVPELQATVSACVESAVALHAITAPRIASLMAGDAVIENYIETLGFDTHLIPWKRLDRDTEPDLILAHQVAGGTSLCPAWLPRRLSPRLTLVPAATNSAEVSANLRRIARILGCVMGDMVPTQRFREQFEGLRSRLPRPGPRVLVLIETRPGSYRLTTLTHPCHQLFSSLGWISTPQPSIAGAQLKEGELQNIEHDAVLILEAWEDTQPGMLRHWPLRLSPAAANEGHWHTESVLTFMCLGPALPSVLTQMALRFGIFPRDGDQHPG